MFDSLPLCQCLKIKYPLILGGMAWIGKGALAAAVSNAGGLGTIGSGSMTLVELREEINRCRMSTTKPFAVNILMLDPAVEEKVSLLLELRVPVVIFGAGNPGAFLETFRRAGAVTMGVVSSENLALLLERAGVDFIIGEGCESGGHIGSVTTMVLIPALADLLRTPVIAAGGIADGRGIAAAFMLGAQGVQIGTRFIASVESDANETYKQMILKSGIRDTVVTGERLGHPVRVLKTSFSKKIKRMELDSSEEAERLLLGSYRKAYQNGNLHEGSFLAGQSAGLVHEVSTCQEIIDKMFTQATTILEYTNTHIIERRKNEQRGSI
ncbi:MAG TPA: nitronate monooxygenase [Thermotogota bacterium]|nr:nitronate monooxygenase [Thermotogota bacterium]HQN21843.1 nitronate monooxygenase [Thermotogota bacterium]